MPMRHWVLEFVDSHHSLLLGLTDIAGRGYESLLEQW